MREKIKILKYKSIIVADALQIPVKYIGVGEGVDDLMPFQAKEFVEALI